MTLLDSIKPGAKAPGSFIPELLVPAGDPEKFRTAVIYGANAVYLGGASGNLRASCRGFTHEELCDAVAFAETRGVKVYYCLNSLPFERDMHALPDAVVMAAKAQVHAFIIADPGVLRIARRLAPHIPAHISTQANTTNAEAVAFWAEAGANRVNLARELSFRDISAIRKALPDMELEAFVHGAMCLAVSGQCLLSAWLNNRPANQGRCTQPCRFEYKAVAAAWPESLTLEEALRPNEEMWTIRPEENYSGIFAPDDLCLLPFLPWFIKKRVTSLKIEGRMKGSSYVAQVTDVYRAAVDAAAGRDGRFAADRFLPDLVRTATRPLSTGFFLPKRRTLSPCDVAPRPLLARVSEPIDAAKGVWNVESRGRWETNAPIELMLPGMRRPILESGKYAVENHRGEISNLLASGTRGVLYTTAPGIQPGVFIRRPG